MLFLRPRFYLISVGIADREDPLPLIVEGRHKRQLLDIVVSLGQAKTYHNIVSVDLSVAARGTDGLNLKQSQPPPELAIATNIQFLSWIGDQPQKLWGPPKSIWAKPRFSRQ